MPEVFFPRLGSASPAGDIISACWLIFAGVWLVSAAFVKPTAERTRWSLRLMAVVSPLLGALLLFWKRPPGVMGALLLPHTAAVQWLGVVLAVGGLTVCLWARFILAGNWSGMVTFKEGHELVVRGPYRYARHPIYTGILLLVLGTAVSAGRVTGFAGFLVMLAGFWFKLKQEEALLSRHFPDSYPAYRARVKALVPFLLT
jgi:protein-S-isoprenylcysteine O-methyltransferase Ste14